MEDVKNATGGTSDSNVYGNPLKTHGQKDAVSSGRDNANANLLNTGKDDSDKEKAARLSAIERRLKHSY